MRKIFRTPVPVSTRALVQRINRKLKAEESVLKASRGARAQQDLGDYYLLDWRTNAVHAKDVDPEDLGRELGVLKAWERVLDE